MYIFRNIVDLRLHLHKAKATNQKIAFVPTMGALHNGHLSLIKIAKEKGDLTVASIFVNPTQFNDPKDLDKYPRKDEEDIAMLIEKGCDVLFLPSVEEMYPDGTKPKKEFNFGKLTEPMEGAHRPGHFEGMVQVVNLLLEIVEPDFIIMGQKDYQQAAIVRQLLVQAHPNTEIVVAPIIREEDGLAMSSRNVRLLPDERAEAPTIYASLSTLKSLYKVMPLKEAQKEAIEKIEASGSMKVDYLEVADAITLQPIDHWADADKAVVCVAVHLGKVRLIDNVLVG